MSGHKNDPTGPREKYLKGAFLSKVILNEIEGVLLHYNSEQKIELVEHFIKLFDELQESSKTKDFVLPLQQFTNREVELLKKFRSAYKPYEAKSFATLFDLDNVLLDKGYFSEEEFNKLTKEQRKLPEQDVVSFCSFMDNALHSKLHSIYLGEDDNPESLANITQKEENDKDMTEARRLLALYYLFSATLGSEHRKKTDISKYARFAHLLFGKKITDLHVSNIYKKYKKLPNYKKGKHLIQDLNYIKPFFQELDLQKAVEMIEKEIETEIKEMDQ